MSVWIPLFFMGVFITGVFALCAVTFWESHVLVWWNRFQTWRLDRLIERNLLLFERLAEMDPETAERLKPLLVKGLQHREMLDTGTEEDLLRAIAEMGRDLEKFKSEKERT